MSEDLIRRSDAITIVDKQICPTGNSDYDNGRETERESIKESLIDLPPAGRPQEWIPCSERLPSEKEWTDSYIRNKKASEFFVMIKGADRPTTLYLSRDHYWFDENRNFYEVVAWMLMPDLPKGADDENA